MNLESKNDIRQKIKNFVPTKFWTRAAGTTYLWPYHYAMGGLRILHKNILLFFCKREKSDSVSKFALPPLFIDTSTHHISSLKKVHKKNNFHPNHRHVTRHNLRTSFHCLFVLHVFVVLLVKDLWVPKLVLMWKEAKRRNSLWPVPTKLLWRVLCLNQVKPQFLLGASRALKTRLVPPIWNHIFKRRGILWVMTSDDIWWVLQITHILQWVI